MKPHLGPENLSAAQELLTCVDDTALPSFGVNGVDIDAWYSIPNGMHTIIPDGLDRTRVAFNFAVSLPGDAGRFVSGFRSGPRVV